MMTLSLVWRGDGQRFVVIGAGKVATRKIQTLVKAGAAVTVIAAQLNEEVLQLADQITLEKRQATADERFEAGTFLVLSTDNKVLNSQLAKSGREQGCFICRVDDTADNDFMFPAVVDRSPLLISISSSGTSPALTRHVRQRIEAFIPQDYKILAEYVEGLRDKIKALLPSKERAIFWRRWMNSLAPELILGRKPERVEAVTQEILNNEISTGEVWLVGAGPGDPDLLTFRALRLIQKADIVYYDRLVNPLILELISPDAERFYVGKEKSFHSVPQADINKLLVDSAKAGKKVLRLKGGDPFIFGRGGEEIEQLAEAGVAFQVVPGITAASGCAAYAGIPLTHREHAQSVRFVTGHLKNNTCDLPWHELIHPNQTLVIYMGLGGLPLICENLINAGMPADTPIALIEKGTLPEQKVHIKTLDTMPEFVANNTIGAPTLTIVGAVVSLYDKLQWR